MIYIAPKSEWTESGARDPPSPMPMSVSACNELHKGKDLGTCYSAVDSNSSALQSLLAVAADWHELMILQHYAAIYCPRWRTIGSAVQHTDIPPLQLAHEAFSFRPVSYYSFPVPQRVGGWVGLSSLLKAACRWRGRDSHRNVKVTSPILHHWTTWPQRHMVVNNFPFAIPGNAADGSRTSDLPITSPTHYNQPTLCMFTLQHVHSIVGHTWALQNACITGHRISCYSSCKMHKFLPRNAL